ncbi:MAG: PEP/pyruvate-binding domain-containing protein [Chloroflexota bacterium]
MRHLRALATEFPDWEVKVMRPAPPLVVPIESGDGDPHLVGGKAASLIKLSRMGYLVPPGFCLTTEAFEAQRRAIPGLGVQIQALPDVAARAELAVAFERTVLDPVVGDALDAALHDLVQRVERTTGRTARLAVRSSGMGEDSSAASFAGLHETELDVAPADVRDAVRRCWASLWSAPAVAYRQGRGLDADGGGMAVVVQALVPAEAAAVVFTRHPVTGSEDQIVITAVRGLGEAMVSGTVTPDTWVLDKAPRRTRDYAPGDRTEGQVGPALDAPTLGDLVDLSLSVERSFGSAVDIEAAMAGGTWYLLQARPITTR